MKRTIGVYAGSFDPIHHGHLHVIKRASEIFEQVWVVIALNSTKKALFTPGERASQIAISCMEAGLTNIAVDTTEKLLVQYVYDKHIEKKASLVRGVRPGMDFDHEYMMADFNHDLSEGLLDTVLIPTNKACQFFSSSAVKEIMRGDPSGFMASQYIPKRVKEDLVKKFGSIKGLS